MVRAMDYEATAAQMKPEDFELLIRAYLMRQAGRYLGDKDITFKYSCEIDKKKISREAHWAVSFGWGDSTRGENLKVVMDEALRRQSWDESGVASLRLLEASPTDTTDQSS